MSTRGIRNNNPFNIKRGPQGWQGETKVNSDPIFCRFSNINYGIRAGIQLLKNGYINKGYKTVDAIIKRYAPSTENNTTSYIAYILNNSPIYPSQEINFNSLSFYHLCKCICWYESKYELTYNKFIAVVKIFRLF